MKGLLWERGFSSYAQVWNDQPPLFTAILGICFKLFGPTIGNARALAAFFGVSLLAAITVLVNRRAGPLAAAVALFCLLAAPHVLELSLSVMLEVPAIGTALWAFWPVFRWHQSRESAWLALSGVLMAAALQMKLTAAIAMPALAVEVFLGVKAIGTRDSLLTGTRVFAIWGGSIIVAYLSLLVTLGTPPGTVVWASHFSAEMLAHVGGLKQVQFPSTMCLTHTDALSAASVGLLLLSWQRQWKRLALPWIWLCTATLAHLQHRPWWPYYYLHFAVPLAWLSGEGLSEILSVHRLNSLTGAGRRLFVMPVALCCSFLLLCWAIYAGVTRLRVEIQMIRQMASAGDSALVAKMKAFADGTRWVYTRSLMEAFRADLPVIPELAVLPLKRFWSGQITDEQVLLIVKSYQPEQLLLSDPLSPEMKEFVESNYALVQQDQGYQLFVAKRLLVMK